MKLIKFSTDCCAQCKQQSKILEALKGVEIIEVDCESHPQLVNQFNIRSVPTLILTHDNGDIVAKFTGITNIKSIKPYISKQ